MELRHKIIISLFVSILLGFSFYWIFQAPHQEQNFFTYAEPGVSFGIYWFDNATSPVTLIDWGYIDIGSENVTIYVKNEGDTPFYTYVVQENWFPRDLYGRLNLYTVPQTQQIGVDETKNMTIVLSLSQVHVGDGNFTGDTIIYAFSEPVSLPDKDVFEKLGDFNTNMKFAMKGTPYVVSIDGSANITQLTWIPEAPWYSWGLVPSNQLSLTLKGSGSNNLKINWKNISDNVKVLFSNGTKLTATDYWNSTTNHIDLNLTLYSELGISIYPEELPRWYSWAWLIPGLYFIFAAILKHIKNPYAKLLTLVAIEDGFLRISLIIVGMPLLMCLPVSILVDTIVHAFKQRNFKKRFLLALLYNSIWYGMFIIGNLLHWSVGIFLGISFHFILDVVIIHFKGEQ